MSHYILEWALEYAKLGWKIFPCAPGKKTPLTARGVKDASQQEIQIREWWKKTPDANIAVALGEPSGRIYVVDVDISDKVNGWESLKTLGESLPKTIEQRTPSGGAHFFYRSDNPPRNKNSFLPGIDIRGDGYYVIIPPSVHPNGKQYEWIANQSPWDLEPAEFPDCLRPETKSTVKQPLQPILLTPKLVDSDVQKRASAYLATCDPAVQGQGGHDKLLWAAYCMVHGFLLSDDQALNLLIHEYNVRCDPPWDLSDPKDYKDFTRKISEARKLNGHPRGWLLNEMIHDPNVDEFFEILKHRIHTEEREQGEAQVKDDVSNVSIVSARDWLTQRPPDAEQIIPGRIDKQDKVFIGGQPKSHKSFFALQMGLCLASGEQFLDWEVSEPQKVLIAQFELKRVNYWRRVRKVAGACGITAEDVADRLHIRNLRGRQFSLDKLRVDTYDLVILDPFYKVLNHEEADEISAKDVSRVLGKIDRIAETGPAVCIVHHGTKGRIGDRQAVDRLSGTGVMSRDYDGCFTLVPHRDQPKSGTWLVVETVLRNYRSPDAQTIHFEDRKFAVRDDVGPEVMTSQVAAQKQRAGPSVEEMVARAKKWVLEPMKTVDLHDRIKNEFSVGRGRADETIRQLEREGFKRSKSKTYPTCGIISPPDRPDRAPPVQSRLPGLD